MDFLRRCNCTRPKTKNEAFGALKDAVKQGIYGITQNPIIGGFAHPGTLMGPGELNLLKQRASGAAPTDQVWQRALQQLSNDTPKQYSTHVLADVHIEWEGPKIGHKEFVEQDGVMSYQQALMWIVSGDEQYARNAANIINEWSTKNKQFHGKNAPLEGGWGVASLARTAELLKHTWPGWAESGVEQRFVSWVKMLILPQLNHEMLERLPQANWHTTIAECKAQLATLMNDRQLWADAVSMWKRVIDVYIVDCGECKETSRDLFHSQFGLGGLLQLAEMAWQQGIDLYSHGNSKLVRAMEFHANITNGGHPKECCYELKGVGFLPCGWEVGYNHYHGRMGIELPETAKMLEKHRPEKYVFHWGLGTLTHYETAEVLYRKQQVV